MHDIRAIRDNPKFFDEGWERRGLSPQTPNILKIDADLRDIQSHVQVLQQSRNESSKKIGKIKAQGGDASQILEEVAALKREISDLEEAERSKTQELKDTLAALPNIMSQDVPDGDDEDENLEISRWGKSGKTGDDHVEIGEKLGLIDFQSAAKMSGSRFVVLKGAIARMERALGEFMMDLHTQKHGLIEISPPLLVNDAALFGTGQLPKFGEDQFRDKETGHWLIPTAEVPLTNIVRDAITSADDLPLRFVAHTPCFRSEAGSAGKDTRGMLRQHQFKKVEMVSIVEPQHSNDEHERMLACAQKVLEILELPYKTVVLCSGDTGFGAQKTYDIEVWLPGQNKYREVSSVSKLGDFQARRMNARYRKTGEKSTTFLHTLNGSGIAIGRTLIAVMENYWDGKKIVVPNALQPYMNGLTEIA